MSSNTTKRINKIECQLFGKNILDVFCNFHSFCEAMNKVQNQILKYSLKERYIIEYEKNIISLFQLRN